MMSDGGTDRRAFSTTARANGVELGIETFGADDGSLVLLAGGPTMLSWPDSLCERLASGGRRVVRYDLRDCGGSTTLDPEAPAYNLRDLAADAAALVGTLGAARAHLGGVGVGGMVAQVAALDHPNAFSALTLVSTRPVAPGPVDDDLPDHEAATMEAVFSRPMPDWTDRAAVAAFVAAGAESLGNDPEQAHAIAARIWSRTHLPVATCGQNPARRIGRADSDTPGSVASIRWMLVDEAGPGRPGSRSAKRSRRGPSSPCPRVGLCPADGSMVSTIGALGSTQYAIDCFGRVRFRPAR